MFDYQRVVICCYDLSVDTCFHPVVVWVGGLEGLEMV